ncbi:MAG: hypothetical protein KBS97_04305, partial [Firmicutes bacterium]|nr:hypothetical protein [Candidatus Fiminaster equi]
MKSNLLREAGKYHSGNAWFPVQIKKIRKSKLIAKGADNNFIRICYSLGLESDENSFCSTCYVHVSKLKIHNLCLENGFQYPTIPDCISKSNRIEERLVAARHIFQSIWTVAGVNRQFKRRGVITNIPVNVDTTV